MKKAEELELYAPKPVRPELDANICVSVAESTAEGRYIKGKVLTVSVWDKRKTPLVVWKFCGDYWIGQLRKEKKPTEMQLHPSYIKDAGGRLLSYSEVAATTAEADLLREYFGNSGYDSLMRVVEKALDDHKVKLRTARNARQARETEERFLKLPELPEGFDKRQIMQICADEGFLWVTNTVTHATLPGGVVEKVKVQKVRCDCCAGEYTEIGRDLKHKDFALCKCCGRKMRIYNTQYPAKRLEQVRTFLYSFPQDGAVWVRKYLAYFTYQDHKAEATIYPKGIWWTDGKEIKQWKRVVGYPSYTGYYVMCQRPSLSAMMTAPSGPYQPYILAAYAPELESDLRKVIKSGWLHTYDKNLPFIWEIREWEMVRRYPMAESLIKTGWADALCDHVYGFRDGGRSQGINLNSKTYYGVFGLNRQELELVARDKTTFRCIDEAFRWKNAGLLLNQKNWKMIEQLRGGFRMQETLQTCGMNRSLKYLRQQTRRIKGEYNGQIDYLVASDWMDYISTAKSAGMNVEFETVRFPLDLKRRHDDLVVERNKSRRLQAMKSTESQTEKEALQLEKQFGIENIYKKIRKLYEYDGTEYIVRVPDGAKDILQESRFLDHCIQRGTRYFERIAKRESYIFFLRRKSDPNTPWYTLEVEPGGTVRQKRSYNNDQYADLEEAKPFIVEWQSIVQSRMSAAELSFARKSQELRTQEFAELKENGNTIRTGAHAGKLLVDELMKDLMEVERHVG